MTLHSRRLCIGTAPWSTVFAFGSCSNLTTPRTLFRRHSWSLPKNSARSKSTLPWRAGCMASLIVWHYVQRFKPRRAGIANPKLLPIPRLQRMPPGMRCGPLSMLNYAAYQRGFGNRLSFVTWKVGRRTKRHASWDGARARFAVVSTRHGTRWAIDWQRAASPCRRPCPRY